MIPAHLVTRIPGCEEGRPPRLVQSLPGGRGCNLVLRVDTDAGRFALRQRQAPLDRPGSAAMTELRCQMAAAAAGLAPRIIQAAMDGSWVLMEFIASPTWTQDDLLSERGVELIGKRLGQLHQLAVPAGVPPLDATRIAAGYLQQLEGMDPESGVKHQPLVDQVRELSRAIARLELPAVLNHGDLQVGNMLGEGPMLVDWEYAQAADPTYDIACLLAYYPSLEARLPLLLRSAGLPDAADLPSLRLQRARFRCLNQLWDAVNVPKAG